MNDPDHCPQIKPHGNLFDRSKLIILTIITAFHASAGDAGAAIFQGDPFTASTKPMLIGIVSLLEQPASTTAAEGAAADAAGAGAAGGTNGCRTEVTGLRLDDSTSQLFLRAHGATLPKGRKMLH